MLVLIVWFLLFFSHTKAFLTPKVSNHVQIRPRQHVKEIPRNMVLYGIPKLFRWLTDLYPSITQSVGEGLSGGMVVDNFYLDMNGIIHTCTHSNNDKLVTLDEREMFKRIFAYTDRLYKLVKPTRMMFLAIDGVAPRAKMNQQRSRRFRSAKEREALLADYVAREGKMPDVESFDSNCITPGTDFMYRLGTAFRHWIDYKMKTDPFWREGAEVVFSGPDVPGEGEHKVMDMIRKEQRNDPEYKNGKFRHCMYGLDADLIMLSLVTHEPHFILLRETMKARRQNKDAMSYSTEDFELLEVSLLRQMLKAHFSSIEKEMNRNMRQNELKQPNSDSDSDSDSSCLSSHFQSFEFNLERLIDDFVFMCFFVGNDFLPCVPHLDIADGSLNLMMNVYRDMLPQLGGYLTQKEKIHLNRVELFLQEIARREPLYFQHRAAEEKDIDYASDNYKDHYYQMKFDLDKNIAEPEKQKAIRVLVKNYIEGLAWVLAYYHNGCSSWTWYFPHLYCPLASDMRDLASINVEFEVGSPFTPLLQLLSVLPPQSSSFLPPSYSFLMTDESSPIIENYPLDFSVDANGKKNSWESVVRIPFINEKKLVDAVNQIDHRKELSESERLRNIPGNEHHFAAPEPLSWEEARVKAKQTSKGWTRSDSALARGRGRG
jgi:5'-3' exonuclease